MEKPPVKARPLALSCSEDMWNDTLTLIPSGAQTFSKAPFQHVDGVAPKFIVRGEGCRVWDLDGNSYIDYMLGLGPVILGHGDPTINFAIAEVLTQGIALPLPHPAETELARVLQRLIPCAEMARFGKNGSDATAGAIRAARGITGRDKVARCGYHGWQDWFIGSTSRNLGVPTQVSDLTLSFEYNKIETLEYLFSENRGDIAAVILEPVTFEEPENEFLEHVKWLTHDKGALLIFDEVITGFRIDMGGAQNVYNVTPDFACFGKAMANGMPISAVVGKEEYMQIFDEAFFSFTFGGELASIAAAKATIHALEERQVIAHIDAMGSRLKTGYNKLVRTMGLEKVTLMTGFNWWPEYLFFDPQGNPSLEIQSLFQQEIVRRGILSRSGMFICGSHQIEDIDHTLGAFEAALCVVADAVGRGKVLDWLDGSVIQPVIRAKASP